MNARGRPRRVPDEVHAAIRAFAFSQEGCAMPIAKIAKRFDVPTSRVQAAIKCPDCDR